MPMTASQLLITNDRQYRITRARIREFEEALAHADEQYRDADPILSRAMHDQIASQLDDLREQVNEYEALRDSEDFEVEVDSLEKLPIALVQARIARGLTERIGREDPCAAAGDPALRGEILCWCVHGAAARDRERARRDRYGYADAGAE